ncbi:MAG TPA: hypothetical protein VIP46_18865 [Pyrinomonadaceae bacterium]
MKIESRGKFPAAGVKAACLTPVVLAAIMRVRVAPTPGQLGQMR